MDLLINTLRSLAYVFVDPYLICILVILGIIFYIRNKKLVLMQKMIIGEAYNSPLELTISQIVIGLFGGVIASLALTYTGIVFNENSGIQALFILSIFLMFIKPRFVCFSYSGAILGLISIVVTYFTGNGETAFHIDIMMLMSFVGILHIVEGILVFIDGQRGSIPVFSNKNGHIIGGYALKRSWVVPIAIFIAYSATAVSGGGNEIGTPGWWPLIFNDYTLNIISTMVLTALPLFGVLGYSSVTFTRKKNQKVISSGLFIAGFGILLILVAQVTRVGLIGEIIAVLFAPISHEAMLKLQKKLEERREQLFVSDNGISVLEVVPYSVAYNIGIRVGDKIISIDDIKMESEVEVYNRIKKGIQNIKIINIKGETVELKPKLETNATTGMVLVPKMVEAKNMVPIENEKFSEVLDKLKEKK